MSKSHCAACCTETGARHTSPGALCFFAYTWARPYIRSGFGYVYHLIAMVLAAAQNRLKWCTESELYVA
eukprot:365611-Chlamydomonas_euryale.AAC.8